MNQPEPEWMTPDPWETEARCPWGGHREAALPDADILYLQHRLTDIERIPVGLGRLEAKDALARTFGITSRTLERYKHRVVKVPCPGEGCLTRTPGGRLCHFCSRTSRRLEVVG